MIQNLRRKIIEGNHRQSVKLEDAEEHVCLNCGTRFRGKHCPECKQKASTKRLDLMVTFKNIVNKYITLDSGLLHTIVDLLYRPGYMVRDYIQGYRIEYVEPLMLLIILIALQYAIPSAFPERAIAPFPEDLNTKLASYPVSLALAKTWYWIFSDMQRMMVMFAFLFGMATNLTLKLIRIGKDHIINISESIHLFLYWICYHRILIMTVNFIFWILPDSMADEDLADTLSDIPSYIVFLIMVHDCTQIGWKKMILFTLFYTFVVLVLLIALSTIIGLIMIFDLPEDMREIGHKILTSFIPAK